MNDNLALWGAVSKTNPAYTKKVNQRGGFTAISAQYQILSATEQFGPIGLGWGYISGDPVIVDTLLMVPVTLWHGTRENTFGPMFGCDEWKDKNGRVDSDAPKKAVTDGLTKLLSQLGFNADVFLGKFDDNKYVKQMEREFTEKNKQEAPKITETERNELMTLMDTTDFPVAKFLKVTKLTDLRELPAEKFEGGKQWINDQVKQRSAV